MTSVLEDAQEISIEKWGGLNTAAASHKLPAGQSPNNQNVWMDERLGSVVTANGYTKLGTSPSGNPLTFAIDFFKTSDGSQTLVLSDGSTVWTTTNYVDFTSIKTGLSPFFQLRGLVVRGKLWLTNGSDDVMTWDGSSLVLLNGDGSTPEAPIAKYISYHDERVWLYGISGEPSSLRFSELTDDAGTEITPDDEDAWPADNELQISEGDADIGTGLFVYRGYLYASKSFSFWRITGFDRYTYTKVKTRSSTGTRFAESIAELDNLVHFIGVDGLYTFNGETSERISDPIDPANPEPGVFSFRNLQQPLLNNQFWNLSDSADWAAGSVPRNISTDNDRLTLTADDTQAQFNAGTKTRVTADDNPGNLQLSLVSSGSAGTLLSSGKSAQLVPSDASVIGNASFITDGSEANDAGFLHAGNNTGRWVIDLGSARVVGRVILKKVYFESNGTGQPVLVGNTQIQYSSDNINWTLASLVTIPASSTGAGIYVSGTPAIVGPVNITTDFASVSARYWRFALTSTRTTTVIKEMEVYQAGYEADGKFISPSIDLGATPGSLGTLAATITTNGEAYQLFTQTSADGSTWDSEVNLANGAAIGSTPRRHLRWGVYLYSSTGVSTPVIDKVFVGSSYLSVIFDTGGNIFQWGAFQLAANLAGQAVTAYYRAAATSGGVLAASWTAIVNGAVPNTAVTNTFIQLRLELSTADATAFPYITGTTVNWTLANSSGVNTLQNVASIVIFNRYWLAAATLGADANDIVLVRGKLSASSPWHKKDFAFLAFCRFQDYFIATSSTNGDIYRIETGFSKNNAAMDSFYETADYDKSGFLLKLLEIIVNTERSGAYDLNIGISIDGGISWTEKTVDLTRTSLTQNLSFTKKLIAGNVMADKFRLRVRVNAADQPFVVDDLRVYYRLSPMRGSLN